MRVFLRAASAALLLTSLAGASASAQSGQKFAYIRSSVLLEHMFGSQQGAAAILSDAATCEVVGANCHRDRTHRRLVDAPIAQSG